MAVITGYYFNHQGNAISEEQFRQHFLIPHCGESKSFEVLNNIKYQLFCVGYVYLAKQRLVSYDENSNMYIDYNDYNIRLRLYFTYYDNTCNVDVVEYGGTCSQSP